MAPPTEPVSLPESHPNPSLQYQYYSDDYSSPSSLGIVSTPKNGASRNSNGNGQKMRIPMERR